MAWLKVGELGTTITAGSGNQSITLPGSPITGDLVLVATAGDISCADSIASAGYTVPENGTGANPGANFGYKVMGATPDTTVDVVKHATILKSNVVQVWRGGDPNTILDAAWQTPATGTSNAPNPTATTSVTPGALSVAVAFLDDDDTTVSAVPSGYTNLVEANTGQASTTVGSTVAISSKVLGVPGPEAPAAYTMGSSDTWAASTITFRAVDARVWNKPAKWGGWFQSRRFKKEAVLTSDVETPLTGEFGSGLFGAFLVAITVGLTGVAATTSVDNIIPTQAISGIEATASVGTLVPDSSVPLIGIEATTAVGTLTPNENVPTTGVEATSAVGTLTPSANVSITGTEATSGTGSVVPSSTVPLVGEGAIGSVGTVVASQGGDAEAALTGVSATTAVQAAAPNIDAPITGPSATASVGTVVQSADVSLTGSEATGAVGSVSQAQAVSGVAATSDVGTASPDYSIPLTGNSSTGFIGTVSQSQAISGTEAAASVGTITPSSTVAVVGEAATGSVDSVTVSQPLVYYWNTGGRGRLGNLGGRFQSWKFKSTQGIPRQAALSGIEATGSVGSVTIPTGTAPLTGVAATGSVGTVTPVIGDLVRALTGVVGTTAVGTPTPPNSVALTGVNAPTAILAWDDNSTDEDYFELERKIGAGAFALLATLPANTTTYTDRTILSATTYTYRVRAVNGIGPSGYSNELVVLINFVGSVIQGPVPTGNSVTGSVGTLALTKTKAITGNAATVAVGSVSRGMSIVPTGVFASASVGILTPTLPTQLTGITANGLVGSISLQLPLASVTATTNVGTLVSSQSISLAGVSGIEGTGTIIAEGVGTVGLAGVVAVGEVGTPTVDFVIPEDGISSIAILGDVSAPAPEQPITGHTAAGSVGTPTANSDVQLSGVSSTGVIGNLGQDVSPTLAGVEVISAVGTVVADFTRNLVGLVLVSSIGTVTQEGGTLPPALSQLTALSLEIDPILFRSVVWTGNVVPLSITTNAPVDPPPNGKGVVFRVTAGVVTIYVWDGTAWRSLS